MFEGAISKTGLTANAVKHARPKEKAYKLSDRDGLYLFVKPTGARYWRMNYRFRGTQRTMSFGRWPEILLGEAREMLLEARRHLARGVDPMEQAKLDKIAQSIAATNSFQLVAEEWLDKIEKEGLAEITLKNVNRRPIGTPYRRAKGTPFALRGSVDTGRRFRAAGGVGRA